MENKSYNYILNEILSKVLELSENPSQFTEYLTHQIRELVGARTIVIAIKDETNQTKIFSVFPVRRTNWANQSAVLNLAERTFDYKSVQFLEKEASDEIVRNILEGLEIDQAIAIPLIAANRLVGSILLLDIMDSFGMDSVITLLSQLSGVFALVIRNANLYQNMDDLVEIRTEELLKRNDELIAERIRAEKSELQAREILQTAMDGFWTVDIECRFIDVNHVACKMLGYSAEEMLTMRISDIEINETAEQTKAHISKIKKNGEDRFE
ncbi:MAG TPA: PAS domain S-box protein, partial [Anaerovoracaceae bacterium]|nr:PAS domain S-box protein [Anaerovoracaceae bacterium]